MRSTLFIAVIALAQMLVGCAAAKVTVPTGWSEVQLGMMGDDVTSLLGHPQQVFRRVEVPTFEQHDDDADDLDDWCWTFKHFNFEIKRPHESWVYSENGEQLVIGFNEAGAATQILRSSRH